MNYNQILARIYDPEKEDTILKIKIIGIDKHLKDQVRAFSQII